MDRYTMYLLEDKREFLYPEGEWVLYEDVEKLQELSLITIGNQADEIAELKKKYSELAINYEYLLAENSALEGT